MATPRDLEQTGCLKQLKLPLRRYEYEDREVWLLQEAWEWLEGTLPKLTSIDSYQISPKLQAYELLKKFITGAEISEGRYFRWMMPHSKDVYELKTYDVRVFGWFWRPRIFIAGCCSCLEVVHAAPRVSDHFRDKVITKRAEIDLDPPKWMVNAEPKDVF